MALRDLSYKVEDGDVLQSFVESLTFEKTESSIYLYLFKKGSTITIAVNNKQRQRILYTLHEKGYLTVTKLKSEMRIIQSTAFIHLKILREAGFVLNQKGMGHLFITASTIKGLKKCRHFTEIN